jgi:hypothetical protein
MRFHGKLKFWSISLRLDPDPHSQYKSGYKRSKSTKIYASMTLKYRYPSSLWKRIGAGRQQEGFFDFQIKTAFLRILVKKSSSFFADSPHVIYDVQSKNIFPRIGPDTTLIVIPIHPRHTYPDLQSGSESRYRRAKKAHKTIKEIACFEVLNVHFRELKKCFSSPVAGTSFM